ncbi:hypothetical protein A1F94_009260 [Pyrenophora tritici-repentis]|nr:hypothetical protein A1F94_009260 [Pyrenophora tritici-repentis]
MGGKGIKKAGEKVKRARIPETVEGGGDVTTPEISPESTEPPGVWDIPSRPTTPPNPVTPAPVAPA